MTEFWPTGAVAALALALSLVTFIVGCVDLKQSWNSSKVAKAAIETAAKRSEETTSTTVPDDQLQKQSAIDFKGTWEALGKLATALKDLDRSSRLFVLSLAYLAVAAAAAGAGEISNAIASP